VYWANDISEFKSVDATRENLLSLSSLYIAGGPCISDRTGSVLDANVGSQHLLMDRTIDLHNVRQACG
jgi:hypothetical protein